MIEVTYEQHWTAICGLGLRRTIAKYPFFFFDGSYACLLRFRERLRHLEFIGHRTAFKFRDRLADDRRQSSTFLKLSRSTGQIALSLSVAVMLQLLGPAADEFPAGVAYQLRAMLTPIS